MIGKSKTGRYVAYYRVSTQKQGATGNGIEAQKIAVAAAMNSLNGTLISEFTEVESGKRVRRPALREAIASCRENNATLVVAKLDRLARNLRFITSLIESDVAFHCCDFPQLDKFTAHILAAVAEREADQARDRTVAALGAMKKRLRKKGSVKTKTTGRTITKLGASLKTLKKAGKAAGAASKAESDLFAEAIFEPFNRALKAAKQKHPGRSYGDLARELNERNVATFSQWRKNLPRDDPGKWYASSARNTELRLKSLQLGD
jgi:DNA invertase Pin-like site-specific DNA recombinase